MLPYPGWVYKNNRRNVPSFIIEVDCLGTNNNVE